MNYSIVKYDGETVKIPHGTYTDRTESCFPRYQRLLVFTGETIEVCNMYEAGNRALFDQYLVTPRGVETKEPTAPAGLEYLEFIGPETHKPIGNPGAFQKHCPIITCNLH